MQAKRQQDQVDRHQARPEDEEDREAKKEQVPKLTKEQIIQQQIRNVYIQTMQKIQQMSVVYQQQQAQLELQHKMLSSGGTMPDFSKTTMHAQTLSVDPLKFEGASLLENDLLSKVGNTDVQSLASNITQTAKAKASEAVASILAKRDPTGPMITIGSIKNDDQSKPVHFTFPIQSLGIQMVDERNKRGRPPKKRKPEVELREKELLNQRIMAQVKQGF